MKQDWLIDISPAYAAIRQLLKQTHTAVVDYSDHQITPNDFFPGQSVSNLNLSNFVATKDSLFYSHLLSAALENGIETAEIYDFGTGSGIPLFRH